ncbi:MAG: hypothetical protein AAF514_16445 [Verrucomicrobiota bacterium]
MQTRFSREIETITSLNHPGIITIYQSGYSPPGGPYYPMPLIPRARPITAFAREKKVPSPKN